MSIDTINDLPRVVSYTASAAQDEFDYPFPVFTDADLTVYVDDVLQALDTDYTVAGEGDDLGGSITFLTPMAGGEIVVIYSELAIERVTDFSVNGPQTSVQFNDEFDRLTLICRELKDRIGRAIRWPFTAAQPSADLELNPISDWYDKFLKIGATGLLEAADLISGVVALTADVIGQLIHPQSAGELANGITPVRYWYDVGVLKRYTLNNGDGSDVSLAFEAMLNSGEKSCFVHAPTSTWGIGTQVDWVAGVSVKCGRGTLFTSSRASGQWAFKFYQITYTDGGAGFEGFILKSANDGANGILISECRNINIEDFNISTNATLGGIALELNGGDNASSFEGCHHNYINNGFIYRHATGIRMYSDNTTSGLDTANCNRNKIGVGGFIHINDCTTGLFMNRANTNNVNVSLQANDTGANIGQYADRNTILIQSESNTYPVVLSPSANNNVFGGNLAATSFVDAVGVQVTPHLTTVVISANEFMFPRSTMLANGGTLRFGNLFGSSARLRMEDTYDHDLSLASHDASDTAFDIFTAKYHATAPYGLAARALVFNPTTITYSASMDTDASLGNAFIINGHFITYTLRNTSGGAAGAATWNAVFKMSTWTNPATAFSRSITFRYNGSNWVQVSQTGVDVPN
jgi:hypothetical protein